MLAALVGLVLSQTVPTELDTFLRSPDPSARVLETRRDRGRLHVRFISQTWKGFAWEHDLVTVFPRSAAKHNTAILLITGGGVDERDLALAQLAADRAGMPVATLFQIPNQPIWDKREDALIAHTFMQYMLTRDPNWPLLFPMTKSAVRAMDHLVEATRKERTPIRRFVVTGASKRGWTTWLTAASGDRRVAGIAPMVYDNLNLSAQMRHQKASWGGFSDEIADYTELDLQATLDSPLGKRLASMVDPHAYLSRIRVPTLIINGANDPYWTVDALGLYWNDLKMPRYATLVPNAGHNLGDGRRAVEALGAFARSVAGEFSMPRWSAVSREIEPGRIQFEVQVQGPAPKSVRVWVAGSADRRFANAEWRADAVLGTSNLGRNQTFRVNATAPSTPFFAAYVDTEWEIGGQTFHLSSPAQVFRGRP